MLKLWRDLLRNSGGSNSIPVCLMRGGTSKGLILREEDVEKVKKWSRDEIVLQVMNGGHQDRSGMQLNGLGGGVSSTSKVAMIRVHGDRVDYDFGQVALKENVIDWAGNCGNLSAAVGLYVFEQQLLEEKNLLESHFGKTTHRVVPVWQKNLGYMMHIHVPVKTIEKENFVSIAGVPGTAPPILVEVVDPLKGQSHQLFPSGNVLDKLETLEGKSVPGTLLWAANPTVFVRAEDIGLTGVELPNQVDYANKIYPQVKRFLEQAAEKMGIGKVNAAMRVCWVRTPRTFETTDGTTVAEKDMDIVSRITTEGRIHHAHTATGALNLGIAGAVEGTVPALVLGRTTDRLRLAHPAGTIEVTSMVQKIGPEPTDWKPVRAGMVRTARTLIEGVCQIQSA